MTGMMDTRPGVESGVEPAVADALDGVDPDDSFAMLELLTFDKNLGDLPGLSEALPIYLADLAGQRIGPYAPAAAFDFLARIEPRTVHTITLSADERRWLRASEAVTLLGSVPIPAKWGAPGPARDVRQLSAALDLERPTAGLVIRDRAGQMLRAIEVIDGRLERDLGLQTEIASHARLCSSSVFIEKGLLTEAHRALGEGRPLQSMTDPRLFSAYNKARSLVLRRWAGDVVDLTEGSFSFVARA